MPRVSIRRILLYVAAAVSFSLLLLTLQQPPYQWLAVSNSKDLLLSSSGHAPGPRFLQVLADDSNRDDHTQRKNDGQRLTNRTSTIDRTTARSNGLVFPREEKLWFFKAGQVRPMIPQDVDQYDRKLRLWPTENDGDRIVDQLMFRPLLPPSEEDHPDIADEESPIQHKKILMYNSASSWNLPIGRSVFLKLKCPVDTCVITSKRSEAVTADAIMFKDHFSTPLHQRPAHQVWIMYMLECPYHTQRFSVKNVFNWTATYRHDSDIVAPYEKWVYYNDSARQKEPVINYAANKTKKVAWFVSNCGARNNRLKYAKELSKYIEVDIYGACGTKKCPRSNAPKCFEMLNKDYKFYLAFENSNCRDYITEKFFVNGLNHQILPIAMGAHPDDYRRASPEKSFIHVDDFESPKKLAKYLHLLDQNDNLYNEYFRWKGTGEFINTYFMCRLCGLLHDEEHSQHYKDINKWWRGPGTCVNGSWRKKMAHLNKMTNHTKGN